MLKTDSSSMLTPEFKAQASKALRSSKFINIILWLYILFDIAPNFGIKSVSEELHPKIFQFKLATVTLLFFWQLARFKTQFKTVQIDKQTDPFYLKAEPGDWVRLFCILRIGYFPASLQSKACFTFFSAIIFALAILLIFIAAVEFNRVRKLKAPVILSCIGTFIILMWEYNGYIQHYGVPILGHLFESPEYMAKYEVELSPAGGSGKVKAIAEIHVFSTTETVEVDEEDRWGSEWRTKTFKKRQITVKQIYFPNGGVVQVREQDETLSPRNSVVVVDNNGRRWSVKLIEERSAR